MPQTNQPVGNAKLINDEIEVWIKQIQASVKDYEEKDRRRTLRKIATQIAKSIRLNPSLQPKVPGKYPVHYRGKKPNRIKYNQGNLRRSIVRLPRLKSTSVFVGPIRADRAGLKGVGRDAEEYGKPGQPSDGYYAQMIFGSAQAFRNRVLKPAILAGRPIAFRVIGNEALKSIKKHARAKGLKTNA